MTHKLIQSHVTRTVTDIVRNCCFYDCWFSVKSFPLTLDVSRPLHNNGVKYIQYLRQEELTDDVNFVKTSDLILPV